MSEETERALFAPTGYPTRAVREEVMGQRGACVWLTGLSASGKTSVAVALQRRLLARGVKAQALDGDVLRAGLCADLDFSPEARTENIRRAGAVAALLVDAGLIVTCAFISPSRADRDAARARFPEGRFVECFVSCPLEVCEQRDPKGLYARARAGQLQHFTGISAPYEPPLDPELRLDTSPATTSPDDAAARVEAFLVQRGLLS